MMALNPQVSRHARRISRLYASLLALYILGFLPLAGIVGTLEGAARGQWGLAAQDWLEQLGGFLVLVVSWLGPSGLVSAAALMVASAWAMRVHRRWRLLVAAVSGIGSVFLGALTFSVIGALTSGTVWWAPVGLLFMPAAFVACSAAYGIAGSYVVERQLRQQKSPAV